MFKHPEDVFRIINVWSIFSFVQVVRCNIKVIASENVFFQLYFGYIINLKLLQPMMETHLPDLLPYASPLQRGLPSIFQFARIHTSSLINIEKTLNRTITKFYIQRKQSFIRNNANRCK